MASVDLERKSTQISAEETTNGRKAGAAGLKISATFCPTEVSDPFDTVEWEKRSAQIKDETGGDRKSVV